MYNYKYGMMYIKGSKYSKGLPSRERIKEAEARLQKHLEETKKVVDNK